MNIPPTRDNLKISTRLVYDALVAEKVATTIISASSNLLEYTDNRGEAHLMFSTCSDKSSAAGKAIADNKVRTGYIAVRLGIPMPAAVACRDIREARAFLADNSVIVTKPVLGSGGGGVSTNIQTEAELHRAYTYAKNYSHTVLAQQHIEGDDVRLLVIGGIFSSAVIRKPAHVIGDGNSSIEELIVRANSDIARNDDSRSSLMHINIHAARRFLDEAIDSIPANNKEIRVVGPANVSMGGSLHEATAVVTSHMIHDAEVISQKLGLGICGVDMMWDRKTNKHYLIEVNATPGIDIHNDPFSGTKSDCVQRYARWLIAG